MRRVCGVKVTRLTPGELSSTVLGNRAMRRQMTTAVSRGRISRWRTAVKATPTRQLLDMGLTSFLSEYRRLAYAS